MGVPGHFPMCGNFVRFFADGNFCEILLVAGVLYCLPCI